jgi:hypothetical protein
MSAMEIEGVACKGIVWVLAIGISCAAVQPARLSVVGDYHKYIDALMGIADFGIHYYDDGAADASVLFPSTGDNLYVRPRGPVIELIRLRERSFPLLIDCLSDNRVSTAQFDGNSITRPMKVPLGYVCLDILMAITRGQPASDPECSDDGLGACMNPGFYFRPDDYSKCWPDTCILRPWVAVVQQKWRSAFLHHRLHFQNPYDVIPIPEYSDLTTRRK